MLVAKIIAAFVGAMLISFSMTPFNANGIERSINSTLSLEFAFDFDQNGKMDIPQSSSSNMPTEIEEEHSVALILNSHNASTLIGVPVGHSHHYFLSAFLKVHLSGIFVPPDFNS